MDHRGLFLVPFPSAHFLSDLFLFFSVITQQSFIYFLMFSFLWFVDMSVFVPLYIKHIQLSFLSTLSATQGLIRFSDNLFDRKYCFCCNKFVIFVNKLPRQVPACLPPFPMAQPKPRWVFKGTRWSARSNGTWLLVTSKSQCRRQSRALNLARCV